MIIKVTLGRWRFTFSMAPTERVVGVNSKLPDGNHILMWDFDDVSPFRVINNLVTVQKQYKLPNIYLLKTKEATYKRVGTIPIEGGEDIEEWGPVGSYIAYCFKRVTWQEAVAIIAATPDIDWNFFKYGVYRGKFTLRVTPKSGRKPKLIEVLEGYRAEDVKVHELRDWVQYETLADGYESEKHEIKVK